MSAPSSESPSSSGPIAASAVIGPDVELAPGVVVGPGAVVLGAVSVAEGVRIGAGAVLDPTSEGDAAGRLTIETGVEIQSGAVVAAPVTLGRGSRITPGSVVSRDVPPHAIVVGNPAQITGYAVLNDTTDTVTDRRPGERPSVYASDVQGVTLHHLPRVIDLRGNLTVGEFGRTIPFESKRYFMVFGVPNEEIRGEHAHRTCKQFLICTQGSCSVVVDDGVRREEFELDDPATGLYLPALTWGIQYKYSADAVLLVFASEFYDSAEYIRDYAEFLELTADRRAAADA